MNHLFNTISRRKRQTSIDWLVCGGHTKTIHSPWRCLNWKASILGWLYRFLKRFSSLKYALICVNLWHANWAVINRGSNKFLVLPIKCLILCTVNKTTILILVISYRILLQSGLLLKRIYDRLLMFGVVFRRNDWIFARKGWSMRFCHQLSLTHSLRFPKRLLGLLFKVFKGWVGGTVVQILLVNILNRPCSITYGRFGNLGSYKDAQLFLLNRNLLHVRLNFIALIFWVSSVIAQTARKIKLCRVSFQNLLKVDLNFLSILSVLPFSFEAFLFRGVVLFVDVHKFASFYFLLNFLKLFCLIRRRLQMFCIQRPSIFS